MAHRPRKTNREAAAQLSISEGTEEAHVQHILGKLDVNTPSQIAAPVLTQRTETPNPLASHPLFS